MQPVSALPQTLISVPGKRDVIPAKPVSVFADPSVKNRVADSPVTFGEVVTESED